MRRNTAALKLLLGFCVLLLVPAFINVCFAQEPQTYLLRDIQLKPGMQFEFEKFLKEDVIPALKEGGEQEMGVWKQAIFGNVGNYILSSPMANVAEFDNPNPLIKAVGPYGVQAMMAKMSKFADSVRVYTIRSLPDLAIATPEGYVPKMGFHVRATITPGRTDEYEKNTKVITEILKKTNAKGFYAHRVEIGGNPNQYYFLVLLDSFADLDAFGMAFEKAASETEMPSTTGIVTLMEYSLYSYDPELSLQPAAE